MPTSVQGKCSWLPANNLAQANASPILGAPILRFSTLVLGLVPHATHFLSRHLHAHLVFMLMHLHSNPFLKLRGGLLTPAWVHGSVSLKMASR